MKSNRKLLTSKTKDERVEHKAPTARTPIELADHPATVGVGCCMLSEGLVRRERWFEQWRARDEAFR